MDPLEALVRYFANAHPEEVARRLEGLEEREGARILRQLPVETALAVLRKINPAFGARILLRLEPDPARAFLARVPLLTAAALLQPMDAGPRDLLLSGLPEPLAQRLVRQMRYAPDSAGGIMVPHALSLSVDLSVQGAISAIRRLARETVYYLYVTDRDGRLVGVLSKRGLLFAGPREPIERLMSRDVLSVPPHLDREEVVRLMDQRGLHAVPVVDVDGRLLGVVPHEQAMKTVREEAFEDLQRMTGAGGDERALSPLQAVVRKRLPWLTLNLGTAFLAALVVGLFEGTIGRLTALAVLMPVVSALSGNTGIQALAVVMRGLALREIGSGNRRRVVLKEALGGLVNGGWIALLAGAVTWLWHGDLALGLVIAAAMLVNMVAAGLLGASIPLVLRALGRDPAQSSSIFLTTLTDIVGLGSFLGLARLFLHFLE